MNPKTYSLVAGILFSFIAVAHVIRLIMGWEATIGGWAAPRTLYVAEFIIVVVLGWLGIRIYLRKSQ